MAQALNRFNRQQNAAYDHLPVDQAQARERAEKDFDFFAGLALPRVMLVALPPFYIAIANLLISQARDTGRVDDIIRFALGLPRGFIKTTFIKVLLAYFIAYDLCEFALVIAATEPHAENIVSDVDAIMGSTNMERVYGSWNSKEAITIDTKAIKQRAYHGRIVTLAGFGAGSSVRGINIDNRRPDFLLCDDMQTKENDASEAESNKLFEWFVGTLLKCVNLRWCMVVYIGNMYSENCILFKLKNHPDWHSLITGCFLADGQSLWPEMHSIESLYASYKHDEAIGKATIWMAEMMNDPIQSKLSPLTGPLPPSPFDSDVILDGAFIVVDPAGFRKVSDENVIAAHGLIGDTGLVLELIHARMNPEETIERTLELAIKWGISIIGIEATGYQQTLRFWMEKAVTELGLGDVITIIDLESKKRSKDSRIIAFFEEAQSQTYYFARTEDRQAVTFQALQYKVGKKNNKDDLLDGCAYGLDMRVEHGQMIRESYRPHADLSGKFQAHVLHDNTPF